MKRNLLLLCLATTLIFSCSKDADANEENVNPIVGTWRATEFRAADPNNSTLNLGAEILANLTAEECYILTFMFNADLTVTVENAVNYVVPNATPTGLSVDCPTQKDTESSTYTYDGSVLTIVDQEGVSQSIKVTIEDNVMTVDATDLDVNNLNAAGSVIFTKA
ncbi:lipocalin family protein [Maribacter sp. 2308TA10-17]|uniref:lipocalin family protein n=1 Tax=Maribacter sp. 2308TA10-17 TaxID=3386276 RepID=UPI0039BC3D28